MSGFAPLMIGAALELAVSVSPTSANNAVSGSTATSPTVFGTVSGGQAPYTYAWAWVTGGTGITILSPTSASTAFRATGLSADEKRTGTARLTVTDNLGEIVQSGIVSVSLRRLGSA